MYYMYTISGLRGRPQINVPIEELDALIQHGLNATELAKHFQCSKHTIYKKVYANGFKMRDKYSEISDADLQNQVEELHHSFPNSGYEVRRLHY